MRNTILLFVCLLCSLSLLADVRVTNVTVKPRWPWNGLVDVTYTVEGEPDQYYSVSFSGHDQVRDEEIEMKSMSSEDTRFGTRFDTRFLVISGTYTATWDVAKDKPGFHSPSFTVNVEATPAEPLYLVVDFSTPVLDSHDLRVPVGYTQTAPDMKKNYCRTAELWLRRIPAGTFMMGSLKNERGRREQNDETYHQVTLTKDFYIGIFQCTQDQYAFVMGGDQPSEYGFKAEHPVECVSYEDIRGESIPRRTGWPENGHAVTSDSFMGRLRKITGLCFDLPTEAQWEYACRAGTTTALNSGQDLTNEYNCKNMNKVGCYYYNQNATYKHAMVGSYLPNAWGLYDCHGNVYEWCLDWYKEDLGSFPVTDPVGPDSNKDNYRVIRGGCWFDQAWSARSADRARITQSTRGSWVGFRIAFHP